METISPSLHAIWTAYTETAPRKQRFQIVFPKQLIATLLLWHAMRKLEKKEYPIPSLTYDNDDITFPFEELIAAFYAESRRTGKPSLSAIGRLLWAAKKLGFNPCTQETLLKRISD